MVTAGLSLALAIFARMLSQPKVDPKLLIAFVFASIWVWLIGSIDDTISLFALNKVELAHRFRSIVRLDDTESITGGEIRSKLCFALNKWQTQRVSSHYGLHKVPQRRFCRLVFYHGCCGRTPLGLNSNNKFALMDWPTIIGKI